jgi:hypothetical protein
MPRYHFDLVDHIVVEDQGGQLLADDVIASNVADRLAQSIYQVRPELRGKGYSILVTDNEGQQVHRVSIDERFSPPLAPLLN